MSRHQTQTSSGLSAIWLAGTWERPSAGSAETSTDLLSSSSTHSLWAVQA